jgi:hypothetical protein
MSDDPTNRGSYRISSGILAKKGNAEPLSKSAISLILASDKQARETDDERLTGAVVEATLELLVETPGASAKAKSAASLTDLLDPNLINVLRRS